MEIKSDWSNIRQHFNKSFRSNFHVTIASVDSESNPTLTPIGSLFLSADQTGLYFEKYPTKLPTYAKINRKIDAIEVTDKSTGDVRWIPILSVFLYSNHCIDVYDRDYETNLVHFSGLSSFTVCDQARTIGAQY